MLNHVNTWRSALLRSMGKGNVDDPEVWCLLSLPCIAQKQTRCNLHVVVISNGHLQTLLAAPVLWGWREFVDQAMTTMFSGRILFIRRACLLSPSLSLS